MKKSLNLPNFPFSDLSLNDLIKLSNEPFFTRSIKERASRLGNISYKGFKYVFHRHPETKKLITFINLYFYIKGAKNKKTKLRETYLLVVKFPYIKGIKNFKRLYDVKIQIFSSDPSFKYYFAYALNKHNAVVLDEKEFKKHLNISLIKPPVKRNPEWKVQLTKHFFKLVKFLSNAKPKKYLDEKWQIPSNKVITIVNSNANSKKKQTKPRSVINRFMRKKNAKPKVSKTKRFKTNKNRKSQRTK